MNSGNSSTVNSARTRPSASWASWCTTTTPSAVRRASSSTHSAPNSRARRNAGRVFSRAASRAPRWAITVGADAMGTVFHFFGTRAAISTTFRTESPKNRRSDPAVPKKEEPVPTFPCPAVEPVPNIGPDRDIAGSPYPRGTLVALTADAFPAVLTGEGRTLSRHRPGPVLPHRHHRSGDRTDPERQGCL